MTHIFVSSCRIDDPHATALIERLRSESFIVLHSPRNPSDGDDARWRNWYESGCKAEMGRANIFISVVTAAWDCSTWMAHECLEALKQAGADQIRGMYFWNPGRVEVTAGVVTAYLKKRLPDDLDELISVLRGKM